MAGDRGPHAVSQSKTKNHRKRQLKHGITPCISFAPPKYNKHQIFIFLRATSEVLLKAKDAGSLVDQHPDEAPTAESTEGLPIGRQQRVQRSVCVVFNAEL